VLQKYKEDPSLGSWVGNQRTCFKNGKMDPERKKMLVEIGFYVNLEDKNEETWDSHFQNLREFYREHGHCELLSAVDRFLSS
jgi:hypothetical protein